MQGKDRILNYFSLLKTRNIIGKSYLFLGDNFSLVKDIVKLINCKEDKNYFCRNCWDCINIENDFHPDLFVLKPQTLTITIENIKECQQFLRLKSFRAAKKALIINEAHAIGEAAANAFLKTLEEPPRGSFIAICAQKADSLIPTIVSRCRKVFLPPEENAAEKCDISKILPFLNREMIKFKNRSDFSEFLYNLAMALEDSLLFSLGGKNRLLKASDCEIILKCLKVNSVRDYSAALKDILEIWSDAATINENLALNLIKERIL